MISSNASWLRAKPAIWVFVLFAARSALGEDPKLDTPAQAEAPTAFAAEKPAPVLDWGVGEGKKLPRTCL